MPPWGCDIINQLQVNAADTFAPGDQPLKSKGLRDKRAALHAQFFSQRRDGPPRQRRTGRRLWANSPPFAAMASLPGDNGRKATMIQAGITRRLRHEMP